MKKELEKITREMYYRKDNMKIMGVPEGITGDLWGISGDLTGITGNLDHCEITEEDRVKGINIMDLVRDA